ncbi:MAG: hypothetical protein Q9159_001707 [Coniocarpon cinnabarinum]
MVARRSDSDLGKANLQFDGSSGQVYSEAVVSAKASKSGLLSHNGARTLPRLGRVRERSSFKSPPSLEHFCVNMLYENIESLTAETLQHVPWSIKKRLWDGSKTTLTREQRFHLWKVLVQNGHRDPRLAYRRLSKESVKNEPLLPLPFYLPFLESPDCAWLTALTISNLYIPRQHLYQLAKLPNLVALDICSVPDHQLGRGEQPLIDDHVLKHFAAHADVAGAFRSLRVLILREFRNVTRTCLQHLNSFLRLSLFGVQNCGIGGTSSILKADEVAARRNGWTVEDERGLLKQLRHEIDMKRTWDGMLRACVEMTVAFEQSSGVPVRRPHSPPRNMYTRKQTSTLPSTHGFFSESGLTHDKRHWSGHTTDGSFDKDQRQDVQQQPDPPLLHFRLGPTCAGLLFPAPIVFFRCVHQHIQEQNPDQAQGGLEACQMRRSESKSRRPSGPHDPPPTKRPKLKAGRKVHVSAFLEMEGVGRSLSCVELQAKR